MTQTVNFEPSSDVSNAGWSLVGGGTVVNDIFTSGSDTNYLSSPASAGLVAVGFPQDTNEVPAGAVIQSVAIWARVGTGAGSPPTDQPASVTFQMQAADNTAAFTSSTVFPTSTISTLQIASFSQDPTAEPWDIHRLNQLILRGFSYTGVADLVRLYQLYAEINYSLTPTVTVTDPSGTQNTAAPLLSWTYSQSDGDALVQTEYRVFTAATVNTTGFDPTTTPPLADGIIAGDVLSVTLPQSLPSDIYWVYVQCTSQAGAQSAWTGRQFSLQAPQPGIPGVTNTASGSPPGQAIASIVPSPQAGATYLTLRDTSNLVGTHMSDVALNDDAESWTTTNCSVARTTATAFPGDTASWAVQATASGAAVAVTGFLSCTGGQPNTAMAQVLAAATGRNVEIDILYYDAFYTYLSTTTMTPVADSTSPWIEISNGDPGAPNSAAYAQVSFTISGCASSEVHYLTHIGLIPGLNMPWSSGGQQSTNLLDAWYSNCQGAAPANDAWIPGVGTTYGTSGPVGTVGMEGATCNELTYSGVSTSLGFRAAGTAYIRSTNGTAFTLNKPTGTATGDLMIAICTTTEVGQINPPAGWSLIDQGVAETGAGASIYILSRTFTAGDPSSWSGTFTTVSGEASAIVMSYSGAAAVSSQFVAETASVDLNPGTGITTGAVVNTDPNAWRISAFLANDTSSATNTWSANTQGPSATSIKFVSAAPSWSRVSLTSNAYTINRPPGIVSGDLMLASVAFDANNATINVPSGWTLVDSMDATSGVLPDGSGGSIAAAVMMRTAGGSEPSSWSGTISSGGSGYAIWGPRTTQCSAYRNCAVSTSQFISHGMTTTGDATTLTTPTKANTNGAAWRVSSFMAVADGNENWFTSETSLRSSASAANASPDYGSTVVGMADSNGPVSSGSYATQATFGDGDAWYAGAAWIAFLAPLSTAPSPPANETSRASVTAGSPAPYDKLGVFDSNGVVGALPYSVTGTYSGTFAAAAAWVGIIRPSISSQANEVSAAMVSPIDISLADPSVLTLAGSQVTLVGSFLGTSAGSVQFTALFYRANVQIGSDTAVAGGFGATSGPWSDCSATFDIPTGTTRIALAFAVPDRVVSDVVYYNRMGINLGSDSSYRVGTAYPAHPIWTYPQIQYSDNFNPNGGGPGWSPWDFVPGTLTNVPSFGEDELLTFVDHTIVPLRTRKYRCRTVSYGLNGDQFTSPWGPESDPVTYQAQNWWLKDISNPDNNLLLYVKYADLQVTLQNTAVQFQALGEDFPIIITQGFKSDTFTLSMIPVNLDDWNQFINMILSGDTTYYLQSDVDQAWWVRPLGNLNRTLLATDNRQSDPLRQVDVAWLEVAPVS